MAFTTLSHHIDIKWLFEAYRRTRKDGAPGVDGMIAEQYEADLESNLRSLLERAKSGTYVAPPVRRVHIPKGDGSQTRPIGIPTFEDKVLQRAVTMLLEAVYEQDFLDCSFGFRPGRSAHQALRALRSGLMAMGGGWIVEVDIRKFFDTLDHKHLREILAKRVRDGVLVRLIGKWLNAGVMEDGAISRAESGTPQGGVISPLLANAYLHEVLDVWFEREVRPRCRGRVFLVRYADDFVIACEREEDARKVFDVLPKRFERYGLTLHPEKTRLVRFGSPARRPPQDGGGDEERPETFDMLGFTHYWAKSRRGFWVVKQKTARSRLARAIKRIAEWCGLHRHEPLRWQRDQLAAKLRGHDAYYGITGNFRALAQIRRAVEGIWRRALSRRSNHGLVTWERMSTWLRRFPLPAARIVHVYT